MRRLLRSGALLLLLFALPMTAGQAAAEPPDESGVVERVQLPWAPVVEDPDSGLVVVFGVSAEEDGCLGEGFPEGDFTFIQTPTGALMFRSTSRFTAYVYQAASIDELCEAGLTTGVTPIAVGDDIKVLRRDNFLNYETGSRTNVFGLTAQGTVYDDQGNAWSLHAVNWQQLDRDGTHSSRTTIRLNAHGR